MEKNKNEWGIAMSSKLDKMLGIARVTNKRLMWKDFTLQENCAYGRDSNGELFASYGVKSSRYGIFEAKPRHIIVFRCVNENQEMPVKYHKTVWGNNSRAIGRRPIIMQKGIYSTPWQYIWKYTQIPYEHPLAREIFRALNQKISYEQIQKKEEKMEKLLRTSRYAREIYKALNPES